MTQPQTLTEHFGAFTVSVPMRDLVRDAALRALTADAPIMLASSRHLTMPAIGQYWPEQYGINCGRFVNDQDQVYALIVSRRAEGQLGKLAWADGNERCAAFHIGGFSDWSMFNRPEGLGACERLQPKLKGTDDAFPEEWHWTNQRYAAGSYSAWMQDFDDGSQSTDYLDFKFWVRAVRRVVLSL